MTPYHCQYSSSVGGVNCLYPNWTVHVFARLNVESFNDEERLSPRCIEREIHSFARMGPVCEFKSFLSMLSLEYGLKIAGLMTPL